MKRPLKITFEQGVPIPPRVRGSSKQRSVFWEMKVDDSHFLKTEDRKKANMLGAFLSGIGKKTGAKFTRRKVEGGWRFWRVS